VHFFGYSKDQGMSEMYAGRFWHILIPEDLLSSLAKMEE